MHRSVSLVLLIGLLGVLLSGLFTLPVRAITNPSSIAILDQKVFRNVKETGDQLWFCMYNVVYSPQPSEPASAAFQFAIYDTTGVTKLFSTDLNYYQENIISIYLTPSQALVWMDPYKVKVMGKSGLFPYVVEGVNMVTRTLDPVIDYKEETSCSAYLLTIASTLQTDWAITLLEAGKLNSTGASTFSTAVPGLVTVYPEIFQTVTTQPDLTYTNWTEAYAKSNSNAGPKLKRAIADIGQTIFGIKEGPSAWMFAGMGGVLLGSLAYAATGSSGAALAFMYLAVPISAVMGVGDDMFRFMALLLTVLAILFGITFILARFP